MKKILSFFLATALIIITLSACSQTTSEPVSSVESVESEIIESSEAVSSELQTLPEREAGAVDPKTGLYMNPFTGDFDIEKDTYGNRPYAIMINNIKEALPQWGITAPDMYYEFLVEGGITRILALFADPEDIPKIGPVRSARTYYVSTVKGYDAIYIHYGGSTTGTNLIKTLRVNDIDGMTMGSAFKRDAERLKTRAIEHTSYTDCEMILAAVEKKAFRTELNNKDFTAFSFTNEGEDITVNGSCEDASEIDITFSTYANSKFEYNEKDKLYYKSEFGKPQVDANNDEQVTVSNVIVIKDRHTVEQNNTKCLILAQKSGEGYYFSEGKAVEIKWIKGGNDNPYSYTLADGTPLKINPGKTWVSVVRDSAIDNIKFS